MAYRSHHCSPTLCYSVCKVSPAHSLRFLFFCLFLLPMPCPFNAPFPFYTFLLLCSASLFKPQTHSTTTPISYFFNILILSLHLCMQSASFSWILSMPNLLHIGVFYTLHSSKTIPYPVCHVFSLCSSSPTHCE
jgi:hypothetical protein